jgi:hypothetical protein
MVGLLEASVPAVLPDLIRIVGLMLPPVLLVTRHTMVFEVEDDRKTGVVTLDWAMEDAVVNAKPIAMVASVLRSIAESLHG